MSNYRAIHSVGQSLVTWLQNSYPKADISGNGPFEFKLVSSGELAGNDDANDGLYLYLYRVTVNEHLRNARLPQHGLGARAPMSLDLHYLLIPWADTAEIEQTVLGWAMEQIYRNPVLDVSALTPEAGWDPGDVIQLIPAELSTEDLMRVWDALHPAYRLSVSYIARVVRIGGYAATDRPAVTATTQWSQIGGAP